MILYVIIFSFSLMKESSKEQHLQWEKNYPLLILYVYPLTKKWSVYNFNGSLFEQWETE